MANWQNFTEFDQMRSLYVNMDNVVAVAGPNDGSGTRLYFSMGADKNFVKVTELPIDVISQTEKSKKVAATTSRTKK